MADYTILSIDDDEAARVLFGLMLKRSGFEVIQAEDADVALEQLEEVTPDLILTDIQLPGMNGLELVKIMREREALDQTAIIVLSAFQGSTMVDDALSSGADEFYPKPLKMDNLAQKLIAVIEKKRSQ